MYRIKYVSEISAIPELAAREIAELEKVANIYPFLSNKYYLNLINWEDKRDPMRRLIIPSPEEINTPEWGMLDPSNEYDYQIVQGIQHKYPDTALLLVSDQCFGLCRYCFRKRLFIGFSEYEIIEDYKIALDYIREHPEINNVLLTGGDPLTLDTRKLRQVISKLRQINHVEVIRIGTKSTAFYPSRITDDDKLPELIREFNTPQKRLYFMLHFCHPREITEEAIEAVRILLTSGAILCNQTPLVRGVNDDPEVLATLCKKLSYIGIAPYYFFQTRPTIGNKPYALPLTTSYQIFQESQKNISGTAKRARFVMSHKNGKIEVIGIDRANIYMKYHRTPDAEKSGKLMIAHRNDHGYWLEDFVVQALDSDNPIYSYA